MHAVSGGEANERRALTRKAEGTKRRGEEFEGRGDRNGRKVGEKPGSQSLMISRLVLRAD